MFGRFFISIAQNAGAQSSIEIAPTQLRGQGAGMASTAGEIANIFSPGIIYLVKTDFPTSRNPGLFDEYIFAGIILETTSSPIADYQWIFCSLDFTFIARNCRSKSTRYNRGG